MPETLGNTSVFPPPPSVYRHFTLANAAWLDLLQSCKANDATLLADAQASEEARIAEQTKALTMAKGALPYAPPTIDLERTLSPPKVEWIEEDGGYQLFGQRWPIPDTAPSLEQLGIRPLFSADDLGMYTLAHDRSPPRAATVATHVAANLL